MKAEEFRQYFSAKNNKSDLSHPIGLEGHKGFFKCLLCGNPHQRGVKYTIHQEEAIICPNLRRNF